MSRSTSDFLTEGYHSGQHQSACWNCSRREDCPYSCVRAFERRLRRAASQGSAAARLLTAEARRLQKDISCAESVSCILRADEDAEHTISHMLRMEMDLFEELFHA